MFHYSNLNRKGNNSPLKREHSLQLEALEERALLSALPWNTGVADTVPAIVAPAAVQNNVIISPLTLEVPQALESDPGVVSEGIYTFNETDYDAHEVECLQTFFELTDGEGTTNGAALFGDAYDVNDPSTWLNADSKGAIIENVDGVMRLTALHLDNANLVGDLDVSGCTALVEVLAGHIDGLTSVNVSGCTALTGMETWFDANLTSVDASGCTALDTLSCNDAPNLTSLDITGSNALTNLACYNTSLTELDVSGRAGLTDLYFDNCPLTSLNISGCTELYWLDLTGMSDLTTLNMSGCTGLDYLDASVAEALVTLDASGCTALTMLELSGLSALTTLNMSGCSALQWADGKLNTSPCDDGLKLASLVTLDVSGCTQLQSLFAYLHESLTTLNASGCTALEYVGAYENAKLASVDVSGCTALTDLDLPANPCLTEMNMSGCTALGYLNCLNAPLTSLDVSECTELYQLECNGTQISMLDAYNCPALEYLVCWSENLEYVIINPDLEYLYLELYDENFDTTWTFQAADETILSSEVTAYEYSAENVSELPVTATSADESQTVRIVTKTPMDAPTLTATVTSTNDVVVTVSELQDAAGYVLEYSANEDFSDAVSQNVSAGNTTITDLDTDTSPLYFRVKALTGNVTLLDSEFTDAQSVIFYDANDVSKLSAFFEQTDEDGVTNGAALFGDAYDVNDPSTWLNADSKGATFEDVDGVMKLTALNLENGNLVGDLDVSGCTALVEVLAGHIDGLTSVNVSGCTALTGMETWFDGNLTSVDASGCTALDTLSCCDDPNLTSLDITGSNALTNLACYNTSLTELDVSGRTGLTDLSFSDSPITSLDASGCTKLDGVFFENNPDLATLNMSGCTKLSWLDLTGLGNLTTLNLSGCTMLSWLDFTGLSNLTTLNMSGCTSMTGDLFFADLGLTSLATLDVSGSGLVVLDTFGLTALTTLNASDCTSLEGMGAYEHENLTSVNVSGCTALTELVCMANPNLTELNISGCTALLTLTCSDNQLTSLDVSELALLETLECNGNKFTKLDVSACPALYSLACWNADLNCILISPEQNLTIDLSAEGDQWTFLAADETVLATDVYYAFAAGDALPIFATNADGTQKIAFGDETIALAVPTMSEATVEMSKVTFTWDAVPNASGYQFEYKAVGSEEWLTKTVNKTSASFVGELGVEYTARVKALGKGLFTDSEYSDEQAVSPLQIVATFNAKKVTVSWLDESPAADTIRYRVANTAKWTTKKLKAGVTSFTFSPKAGTNYEFQVLLDQQEANILQGPIVMLDQAKLKADKAAIQYDSFQVNVTNYTAKNLADNATQAILTVNGVQTTVDIEDQFGESDLANGGKVTFENGLFTFTDMASNTKYDVQVSFTDDVCVSTMSKLSVKTVKASYEAPVITSATPLTDTSIEVTWETAYGQKSDTPAQKYTVQYSLDGNKWSNATTGATGNAYTIQKLKGGNLYKVRVLATKDNAFNASVASAVLEAETLATPKMALVKGTVTSSTFQISVANYATTNLVIATTLNVRSDQFGDVVIIVVNGTGSSTFGNGMTVAFENGSLTFEHAPANMQQKIQISFGNGVCTTAWSSALSVKTAKAA